MNKAIFLVTAIFIALLSGCKNNSQKTEGESIKAYDIDFNWGEGGPNGFARPGLWADANPEDHVNWYATLGCNVIQSFAVSCNGYAWYKNGIVPEQPGLKYDFLTEEVKMAHKKKHKGIRIFLCRLQYKMGTGTSRFKLRIPFNPSYPIY